MTPPAATARRAPPATMTVFCASGDLAARKLYPALAGLARDGMLPDRGALVGTARSKMSDDDFRQRLREAAPVESDRWTDIVAGARYVAGDYDDAATYQRLAESLDDLERDRGGDGNRLFYLAAVPAVFADVITALGTYGRAATAPDRGWTRVVIEKPLGHDLESAKALDELCHR